MGAKLKQLKAAAAFSARARRLLALEDFAAWVADIESQTKSEIERLTTPGLPALDTEYVRGIIEGSRRIFRELRANAEERVGEEIAKAIRVEEERLEERRTEREPVGLPGVGLRGDGF